MADADCHNFVVPCVFILLMALLDPRTSGVAMALKGLGDSRSAGEETAAVDQLIG